MRSPSSAIFRFSRATSTLERTWSRFEIGPRNVCAQLDAGEVRVVLGADEIGQTHAITRCRGAPKVTV